MQVIQPEELRSVATKFEEFMKYTQRLSPGNSYLIVNRNSPVLYSMASLAAHSYGLDVRTFDLSSDKPYEHFPEELLAYLRGETPKAGMGLFDYSQHPKWHLAELGARIEFLFGTLQKIPTSWGHSPGITWDMAINGAFQCDYKAMAEKAERMLGMLKGVKELYITAPGGTDIEIGIPEGIFFETDCIIVPPDVYGHKGKFGNLPVGEVWAEKGEDLEVFDKEERKKITQHYPVKLIANGVLVCDVCAGGYEGLIDPEKPIRVEFKDGKVVDCSSPDYLQFLYDEMAESEKRYGLPTVLEEVGIGFNDEARATGNMLESEKLGKTVHLAPGNIRVHEDLLFSKPTIHATHGDGSKRTIMEDGVL